MSLPLVVRDAAEQDLTGAYDWYEQRSPGKGDQLVAAVQLAFDRIAANPRLGRVMDDPIRRVLVPGFSHYAIFYYVRDDSIVVTCVFHTSRDPAVWQGRQ